MAQDQANIPVLKSKLFSSLSHINHGFLTRQGGVSQGIYQSLNLGASSDDLLENIGSNKKRVAGFFGVKNDDLLLMKQVHGIDVELIDKPYLPQEPLQVDGLITKNKDLALSVLTADCAPVLFCAKDKPIVAAAHAGWRGARYGILNSVVKQFRSLDVAPEDILVAIGPCIAQNSYEVDPVFYQNFMQEDKSNALFFQAICEKKSQHYHFDLRSYIARKLQKESVKEIDVLPSDTYAEEETFFSYRRSVHRKEKDYGRQLSVIKLL